MTTLFTIGITNAAVATGVAVLVWCVTRIWRQPSLVQLLWVLVLVKLVTPPLVSVPWHFERSSTISRVSAEAHPATISHNEVEAPLLAVEQLKFSTKANQAHVTVAPEMKPAAVVDAHEMLPSDGVRGNAVAKREPADWISLIMTAWLAGSVIWLLIALVRLARFHRALRETEPCGDEIQGWADEVAAKLGVTGRYRLRLTDANLSPLVWPIGKPTIVLSRRLLTEMSPQETRTLLAHELAHLRRNDHWLRWFELLVTCAYWWHPVVWWARRAIQCAEEQSCDAWVLWAFPDARKRYASALFTAVQLVSERRTAVPMIASGLRSGGLKQRIEDIMDAKWNCRLSGPGRIAIVLTALLILPLSLHAVIAADEAKPEAKLKNSNTVENKQQANPTSQQRYSPPKKSTDVDTTSAVKDQRIRAGMHVVIKVDGLPADAPIADEYVVEPSGTVPLGPSYGRVRIEGMTIAEAEAALKKHLEAFVRRAYVQVTIPESSPARSGVRSGEAYRITPGDVLQVIAANVPADMPLADDFMVEPGGTLPLGPVYGRAKVAGLTFEEAEAAIKKQLERIAENPHVQVTLGGWRNKSGHSMVDANERYDSANAATDPQTTLARSREEIEALREHVEFLNEQFKKVDALYRTGSRGGSFDTRASAAYELAMAQCDLELALGRRARAIERGQEAEKFAKEALESTTASYNAGRLPHDRVLQASHNLADCKRRLARLREPSRTVTKKPVGEEGSAAERAASESLPGIESSPSVSVWKKIVEQKKRDYERMKQLAEGAAVSAAEVEKAKAELEIAQAQYEHRQRTLKYAQLELKLAETELQEEIARPRTTGGPEDNQFEVKKLQIKVEMAKVKVSELE
jgi:beta-lactamase regulating signal transducer with metallopeptidase domain/protein involved in polysaccharide export with SLBB domain